MKKLISVTLLLSVLILTGCTSSSGEKYHVDYCGQKDLYTGAKDYYKAGQQVTVYYDYRAIGTDTDYYFYLDGERINYTYEDRKGFEITFTMPDHDVTLKKDSVNSMYVLESDHE